MNDDSFFRQATTLLSSSLNLPEVLHRFHTFIADVIPADEIYVSLANKHNGSIRYIAKSDRFGGTTMDWTIELPEDPLEDLSAGRSANVFIYNRPTTEPMASFLFECINRQNWSNISLIIRVHEQEVAAVDIYARGFDRYTEEHARLFDMLEIPFSNTIANNTNYLDLLRIKENLSKDQRTSDSVDNKTHLKEVIGLDRGLKDVYRLANQVAPLNNTVLILGETGSGKEVIAKLIHRMSKRMDKPLVAVNCGAIPEGLIDSELFGHEKGAFTGATSNKKGRFEQADKGTLFLDEIGELPLPAQVRLLRVLQNREIEKVGGNSSKSVNVRVIAATHRNLENMVKEGKFREDLWYRINGFPIPIPPLRHRQDDTANLARYMITEKSKEFGISPAPELATSAMDYLSGYDWPGNVRELEHVVERELIRNPEGPLTFNSLVKAPEVKKLETSQPIKTVPKKLDDIIVDHIKHVLELTNGKVHGPDGAAAILDVNPSTLRKRMNKLGISYSTRYKQ